MKISTDAIISIVRNDAELCERLKSWNGEVSNLYLKHLPAFEAFLFQLPEDLTLDELEIVLHKQPVDFRLLFGTRLSQFIDRLTSGYEPPHYKSLSDLLKTELYENHPDKINYLK